MWWLTFIVSLTECIPPKNHTLDKSVSAFSERFDWGGRTYSDCGLHTSCAGIQDWIKMKKWVEHQHSSVSWLQTQCEQPLTFLLPWFHYHAGVSPCGRLSPHTDQNTPFLPLVAFVVDFTTVRRRAANTQHFWIFFLLVWMGLFLWFLSQWVCYWGMEKWLLL